MWKKALLAFSLLAFTVVVSVPHDEADARPRSFRSPTKSFNKTPAQSNNMFKSNTSSKSKASASGTTANRGFFSGGSFLKGMMIGGIAGMLFGHMFGGMGMMGNMLGFMLNLVALFALFWIIRSVFDAIRRRRDSQRPNYPNDRRW
jgi:predicted lipid-binding transport protein (Tim44 family)